MKKSALAIDQEMVLEALTDSLDKCQTGYHDHIPVPVGDLSGDLDASYEYIVLDDYSGTGDLLVVSRFNAPLGGSDGEWEIKNLSEVIQDVSDYLDELKMQEEHDDLYWRFFES